MTLKESSELYLYVCVSVGIKFPESFKCTYLQWSQEVGSQREQKAIY